MAAASGPLPLHSTAADDTSLDSARSCKRQGRGSNGQRQTSPHSGQFMKASLLKSYQFVPKRTTGRDATGILAFFATLPRDQRRAKFTMPRQNSRKGRFVFKGRSSSVDFLPMTLRTRFLITALFLCHQVLAAALVTRQLLSENSDQAATSLRQKDQPADNDSGVSIQRALRPSGRKPRLRFGHHLRRPAGKRRRRLQTARQRRNSLSHLRLAGR